MRVKLKLMINLILSVLFSFISFKTPVPSLAPGNITSTNSSSTSLLITWQHIPKKLVHGILLGYRVFYHQFVHEEEIGPRRRKRAIDIVNETIETLPPNATLLRILNLTKFTNYSFRIVGFTSKGAGKMSQTFNVSTDEDSKLLFASYVERYNFAKYYNNDAKQDGSCSFITIPCKPTTGIRHSEEIFSALFTPEVTTLCTSLYVEVFVH